MLKYYKTESLNAGQLRMAKIPQSDIVYSTPGLWIPLARTKNVLIFPGVPILFRKMVDNWFETELIKFVQEKKLTTVPRIRLSVKTYWKESDLAEKLTQMQIGARNFNIALGSYPKMFEDGSTFVVISVSGPLEFDKEMKSIVKEIIESFNGEIFNQ